MKTVTRGYSWGSAMRRVGAGIGGHAIKIRLRANFALPPGAGSINRIDSRASESTRRRPPLPSSSRFHNKTNEAPVSVILLIIGLILFFPAIGFGSLEERTSLFQQGVKAVEEGDFGLAQACFESVAQSGIQNGHLFYNLGNIYFRQGKIGLAMAAYLKARSLIPRDPDLRYNLNFVRKRTQDRIEPTPIVAVKQSVSMFVQFLSQAEWWKAFCVFHALFWILAIGRFWLRHPSLRLGVMMSGSLTALTLLALFWGRIAMGNAAVVTESTVSIYSGPGNLHTELFRLHEGTELRVTDQENEWIRLKLADGKQGWLESRFIEKITGPYITTPVK